ncbi:Gfo/Idh/MocA family protein [Consotaella aegiceratis]|uniref:Gfo/Idh/MocA family protein n=1 Tax=Consotaella aegiceratis TaxID=3097961 RepID=UPI002F42CDCF
MKIGIVGLGYRLGYLAQVMSEIVPDARVVGYVDPAPAGLPLLQKKGIASGPSYETIEALVAAEKPDLLMVGSPNHLHLDHIRTGLEFGLKIFSEKPVVTTEEQTFELLDLLARSGGRDQVMIGLVLRYAPLYRDLVAVHRDGTLGKITSIEASEHIAPYHGAFFMRDWRRAGGWSGGFMLEKCCHDIDLYQGLVGGRPTRISSFGGRRTFVPENSPALRGINDLEVYYRKPSGWMGTEKVFDSDGDIIDYQMAMVEFEGGETLSFHTNLNVPDEFRRFCVVGSRGMAEGDFVRNFFRVHDAHTANKLIDKSYEASPLSVHYGADEQMIGDIFAHVIDGKPLPVSIVDGLAAGLTAIKMDEARARRQVIEMAPTWQRFDSYGLTGGGGAP